MAKKAPVKKTVAQKAPAKQKAVAKKKTVITARIDIAFGNTLYLRGEGPGLSWDAGVPMNSIGADEWSITLPDSKSQVIFKFLVNDISWNTGAWPIPVARSSSCRASDRSRYCQFLFKAPFAGCFFLA